MVHCDKRYDVMFQIVIDLLDLYNVGTVRTKIRLYCIVCYLQQYIYYT